MLSKQWILFGFVGGISGLGCGGDTPEVQSADDFVIRESVPLKRRACKGDSETLVDANGDGQANIRHVMRGGKEACVEIDMNLDGRIDVTRLFMETGEVALEQHDFDFDGRLDQQGFYEGGKLVRKELDTNFDKLVDTWIWCEGTFVSRLERDRHHRGRVDTWEVYEQGRLSGVRYDDNTDGKVERWETYKAGRLASVALDANFDGNPDDPMPQRLDSSGPSIEPVSCDGNPLPQIESASTKPNPPAATAADAEQEPSVAEQAAEDAAAAEAELNRAANPEDENEANLPDPDAVQGN